MSNAVIGTRAIKAHVGALALMAGAAAAAGATVAPSLFGALAALALGAAAALAASLELVEADRHRGWRVALWATLMAGWIALAAVLLNLPLLHLAEVRLWSSALLVGAAALRIARYHASAAGTSPGLVISLALALFALAVIWIGGGDLMPVGGSVATAIGIGCAAELFGSGTLWLGEAFVASLPAMDRTLGASAAPAAMPMA